MKQIDLVCCEIRSVRAEDLEDFVPGGHVNFKIELRLRISEPLPGFADLARLLFTLPFTGRTRDDGGGLQALSCAKDTVPEIIRCHNGEADRFAAFFRETEGL